MVNYVFCYFLVYYHISRNAEARTVYHCLMSIYGSNITRILDKECKPG